MKWFEQYVKTVASFRGITCSLHVEHVDTPEKMQDADKLILCPRT